MKRSKFLIALFACFLTVASFAQTKKVAVVTFFINKQIDVTEFGPVAFAAVQKLNEDPKFNLTPILKSFHEEFFNDYSKSFPFELLPEDQVTNNDAYKSFVPVGVASSGILEATKYRTPIEGYKILLIDLAGHSNEKEMVKIFNQCDGIMDVGIHFKLVKIGLAGMGIVKVKAQVTMSLFNKNGDRVFYIDEDENSKGVNALVGGVPVITADMIMPMCESAMSQLMVTLQKDMRKIVKKANSKL